MCPTFIRVTTNADSVNFIQNSQLRNTYDDNDDDDDDEHEDIIAIIMYCFPFQSDLLT